MAHKKLELYLNIMLCRNIQVVGMSACITLLPGTVHCSNAYVYKVQQPTKKEVYYSCMKWEGMCGYCGGSVMLGMGMLLRGRST